MEKATNADLIKMILDEQTETLEEEELLNLLMQERVSKNVNDEHSINMSLGDRMADNIAQFAGSWKFIGIFACVLFAWILFNSIALISNIAFDKYPFILMNLILSCVAAIQAPVIMMSQNRQEKKDRLRSEHDYEVNLKAEILIENVINRLEKIEQNQAQLAERLLGSEGGKDTFGK